MSRHISDSYEKITKKCKKYVAFGTLSSEYETESNKKRKKRNLYYGIVSMPQILKTRRKKSLVLLDQRS